MLVRISKWGNSLALRIPAPFAQETGIESGTEVDLALEDGKLVITPRAPASYSLDELLARVTEDNRHDSIDAGAPQGGEAW
jgi:antitoxin MazE